MYIANVGKGFLAITNGTFELDGKKQLPRPDVAILDLNPGVW